MRTAQPPVDPPEARMMTCLECDGNGKTMHYTELLTVRVFEKCTECDGTGEVDFDPDADPYAPDNWKEAEGIA